jgi:hypothetical protein
MANNTLYVPSLVRVWDSCNLLLQLSPSKKEERMNMGVGKQPQKSNNVTLRGDGTGLARELLESSYLRQYKSQLRLWNWGDGWC